MRMVLQLAFTKQVHSPTRVYDDDDEEDDEEEEDDDEEDDDDGDDCALIKLKESIYLDVKDTNSFEFHQLSHFAVPLSRDLFPFADHYTHNSTITVTQIFTRRLPNFLDI